MLRTGTGILSNVKMIIEKREHQVNFFHWTDAKAGTPEQVGRMASMVLAFSYQTQHNHATTLF